MVFTKKPFKIKPKSNLTQTCLPVGREHKGKCQYKDHKEYILVCFVLTCISFLNFKQPLKTIKWLVRDRAVLRGAYQIVVTHWWLARTPTTRTTPVGVPANRNSCHVAIIWYAPVLSKHGSGIIFFVFCFLIFNPKKDDEKIYFPAIVPAVG
jgi:hypothetical protein